MAKLIICADDFAMHEAIDQAILTLIQTQKLSATATMVLSPRWPEAAQAITASIRKQASIGLHLDFTEFGDAIAHKELIWRCYSGRLDRQWLAQKISDQLDRFEQAMGTAPDYIDGHQHVHQLPWIRTELIAQIQQRYANRLPWIRVAQAPRNADIKSRFISRLGAAPLLALAQSAGISCSPRLLGVYGFHGSPASYQHRFQQWLAQAAQYESTALMCHPSLPAPTSDPIGAARYAEYQALMAMDLPALLASYQLHLSTQP